MNHDPTAEWPLAFHPNERVTDSLFAAVRAAKHFGRLFGLTDDQVNELGCQVRLAVSDALDGVPDRRFRRFQGSPGS